MVSEDRLAGGRADAEECALSLCAVVGSRFGVDQTKVDAFLAALMEKHPETVVVSGGAKGADSFAEQGWRSLGGKVLSFRVRELPSGGFGVMKYELRDAEMQGQTRSCVWDLSLLGDPTWETVEGALFYRNMLIADEAERCVAFWNGRSAGTRLAMDLFRGRGKPVHQMSA